MIRELTEAEARRTKAEGWVARIATIHEVYAERSSRGRLIKFKGRYWILVKARIS